MKRKFDGKDGKVIYFDIEEVSIGYPDGTLKVEAHIYPIEGSKYSSFIYTKEHSSLIEDSLSEIADRFLTDGKNSYSSKQISDGLSIHLNPIFPQKKV